MNVTLDECFQFGLGAFETIGIEQGIPILLDKHLKRLERAADFLKLGSLSERGITARKIEKYLEEQKMRTEVQKEFRQPGALCIKDHAYQGKHGLFSSCQSLYTGKI